MSLRFLEGQFWAFGELGAFFTSRDGRSWVDQSRWQSGQLNDVAFGHGRYVVVGNAVWLSSADGRTWEEHRSICGDLARCPGVVPPGGTPTGFPALFSVVFGNGTFVTDGGVGTWASSGRPDLDGGAHRRGGQRLQPRALPRSRRSPQQRGGLGRRPPLARSHHHRRRPIGTGSRARTTPAWSSPTG
jgi:hypothetical protein